MGSELQAKYQKLAQEYAKLRSQIDVLKKAIRDDQTKKAELEVAVREKTLSLRKYVQENESLEFRNQQLSKRVAMLQEDLNSPARPRKKKGGEGAGMSDVHTQELAAKIAENERLHMKLLELTQKSERTISSLESKISTLEREVATHNAGAEEVNREHSAIVELIKNEKAMVEAKLAVQISEAEELKKAVQKLQLAAIDNHVDDKSNVVTVKGLNSGVIKGSDNPYSSLNVPVVDSKLQTEVVNALRGGLELFSTFTTQLSTFHSYLEQRCKTYPRDTAEGIHMSVVNQKLCELLHESSSFTRPLLTSLTDYCDKLANSPFSNAVVSELSEFSNSHHKFVLYMETLTPYLQLSLQEESGEMICGPQLSESNERVAQHLTQLTAAFVSVHDYIAIICEGPSKGIPLTNVLLCVSKLQDCLKDAGEDVAVLSEHFSTKIAQEYNLPTASQMALFGVHKKHDRVDPKQCHLEVVAVPNLLLHPSDTTTLPKLNTTNECIVSSLNGMRSTTQQLSRFLQSHSAVFKSSLKQSSQSTNKVESDQSSIVQTLRLRAAGYMKKLSRECPESVPYTLAVHNARSHSSSSESRQTFLQQVTANQDRLAKLEQEKEQLVLDLQLLRVKFEKEQKKAQTLEDSLTQAKNSTPVNPPHSSTSPTPAPPNLSTQHNLSDSVGCLSAASAEGPEEEVVDDMAMIRQHFVDRIVDISTQVQEADSKAAHYYAECRGLHKQLSHSAALRTKLAQDLEIARDALQQLQDQLATTSSNYEKQLSAMSDHLCEVNDKLLKQSDELEVLKKSTKGKRWTGKS